MIGNSPGTRGDFMLAAGGFVALVFWKVPPLAVVIVVALGGTILAAL